MIVVRLAGFLSPSEQKLTDNPHGIELLKKVRTSLFEGGRTYLESLIKEVLDASVVSTYSDVSTKTGEKIIIIVTDRNLEDMVTKK